ncbi:uncharacterized protein LOC129600733 [Paramacrobiotus metropolitanus]|uniref:uncharacterized protein LOC129600733 n=1 Tax=Paramacrobiotus metropolitanus TaxID=2943436 RepID=UPI002445D85A|nr:uncharacterized protein LOC129600733 [Paramacrobiotus metropolitanus]
MRVCGLWQAILSDARTTQHLLVLTHHFTGTQCDDHNCRRIATALCRSITPATKSLTITARAHDWERKQSNWHSACIVPELLRVMQVKLSWIAIQSFCLDMLPDCLLAFQSRCDALVVEGLEMSWGTLCDEMRWNVQRPRFGMIGLPEREYRFTKRHNSAGARRWLRDGMLLGIPRIIYPWRDGWHCQEWDIDRPFMWSTNRLLTPVTADVYAQVAAVRARWCDTLAYPDEWRVIRCFLDRFSGFHANGSAHTWHNVDLRTLDLAQLSALALREIAEIFAL